MSEAHELMQKLQKVPLPLSKLDTEITVEGVYGCPDQWKTTDDANPNMFAYTAKFCTVEFTGGKIHNRKQTEREIREQEEAAKKKGGKKQAKPDPAEQERIRKQKEADAEEDRKKQEEWDKLTDEEKKYAAAEDPFKSPSLKFEKNVEKIELVGSALVIFEERLQHDKGEWVYLYKYPAISEDEIAKLKKGKPKNLNLNDLNPVTMRAWVNYTQLAQPGATSIRVRCPLQQVDETADTPKPNLQKAYILIKINLAQPVPEPQREISSKDLIKPPPVEPPTPLDVESVNQLREQIRLDLQSIAMEYSNAFWKELNFVEEQKNINTLAIPKRADINRRKQQFLYEFNMTGKYRILKERMKKAIVKICKHKYANVLGQATSFTGVSTQSKDQFYSQIYNFLVSTTQDTLQELIKNKKQELHMTNVPSYQQQVEEVEKSVKSRIDETVSEKAARLCSEFEDVRDIEAAKDTYTRMMDQEPDNMGLKLSFSKFCLKNKIGSPFPQKIITLVYECLRHDRQNKQLKELYSLLLMSTKKKAECKQAWIFISELLEEEPDNSQLLMLASFLFGSLLGQDSLATKYQKLAERIELRKINTNFPGKGHHSTKPIPSQVPTLKGVCEYNLSLSDSDRDKLYIGLLRSFSKYSLYNLAELLIQKITDKLLNQILVLSIRIEIFKGNNKLALQKALELFEKNPSFTVAELITQISFELKNHSLCQQYLKKCFKYPEVKSSSGVYIKLAIIYFANGRYGNSKACLVKLIEANRNHSLAWLKLGQTELCLGEASSALNCLRQANMLNPEYAETWLSLSETYLRLNKVSIASQCLISYIRIETQENKSTTGRKKFIRGKSAEKLLAMLRTRAENEEELPFVTGMIRTLEQVTDSQIEAH